MLKTSKKYIAYHNGQVKNFEPCIIKSRLPLPPWMPEISLIGGVWESFLEWHITFQH